MNKIIIIGAGALGQEIAWLIEEINDKSNQWTILGFLDDYAFSKNNSILDYPCLGEYKDASKYQDVYFALGFGDPRLREKVYNEIDGDKLKWATLISPTVRVHRSNNIGEGVIIGRNADLTISCKIQKLAYINVHVVLGHEVEVGEFTIISPNVTINGGGKIGKACQIGANAFVKDVTIGNYSTVGASSCVVKSVEEFCVVAGVPAKLLHKGMPTKSISRSERDH